jgi:hypothetical protein
MKARPTTAFSVVTAGDPMFALIATLLTAAAALPADTCGSAKVLPAYAHNDYRNRRPLLDALTLGYRGVEADVFRVGQDLRVAHERDETKSGKTLALLYLGPLLERVRACGYILPDSTPFLLNIELKERDPTAFRLLIELLRTYDGLFAATARPVVRVTLVGWWPDTITDPSDWPEYLRVQIPIDGRTSDAQSSRPVGLVSVDYGKTLRWSGRGPVSESARNAIATARRVAASYGVPIRVHHAPARPRIYEWLVAEGVTLIGSVDLIHDRELLLELSS